MKTNTTDPLAGDVPFKVEKKGIDPISDAERHGTPRELFGIWFAASISYLPLVYGGIFWLSGINLWQSALVALCATVVSFALLAFLSASGVRAGAPTLTVSRAAFGPRGNLAPALMSWFNALGWDIIACVLVTDALLDALKVLHFPASGPLVTVICLVLVALLVGFAGFLGHATIVRLSLAATIVLGLFSLAVGVFLLLRADWAAVLSVPAGPWGSAVLPLLSLTMAALGLTWVTSAGDYTRYLPRQSKTKSLLLWTIGGAMVPTVSLILLGYLLTSAVPGVPTSSDPVAAVGAALPGWMALPYLLAVIGGLIAGLVIGIYSSGLILLSGLTVFGVSLPRSRTVWIDVAIMFVESCLLLLVVQSFVQPFESFLQIVTVPLMAWSAIFLLDMVDRKSYDQQGLTATGPGSSYYYRGGVNWPAGVCWLIGILVGLLFTSSPKFIGPLATSGFFATTSCGYALGFVASAVCYAVALYGVPVIRRRTATRPRATRAEQNGRSS